ncbi:hypothetical protein MMC11_006171 [Xylographa trunciseda]|nr:hypothetical protein [Xylographa trunciseda]
MRQCLTSPDGGYYTTQNQDRDQFGQKGDFITSPEISQIFGELLGIWLVAEWMAQGRKSHGVEIVEVGPGRGTLMDDILRTIRNFKPLAASIEAVYLVEASPSLRDKQKQLLCGDEPMKEIDIGFRSRSKYSNLPVIWCEDIRFVPNGTPLLISFFLSPILDTIVHSAPSQAHLLTLLQPDPTKTPFIFAHEFFDALPIHAFQSVAPSPNAPSTIQGLNGPVPLSKPTTASQTPQWRELVVTPSPPSSTTTSPPTSPPPDFQLSLAKASTPNSLVLPETSPRYKALKAHPGSVIEICPEARSYAAEFARRIGGSPLPSTPRSSTSSTQTTKPHPSGAALILDYGPAATIPTSTLRGIRAHALVSPFASPGQVDLSADVDFTALAEAALEASPGVEVHGPVEQGAWLERMGIRERAAMLGRGSGSSALGKEGRGTAMPGEGLETQNEGVRKSVERLVERGGGGMGRLYKVLAIVPESGGRGVVGFGGDVD